MKVMLSYEKFQWIPVEFPIIPRCGETVKVGNNQYTVISVNYELNPNNLAMEAVYIEVRM